MANSRQSPLIQPETEANERARISRVLSRVEVWREEADEVWVGVSGGEEGSLRLPDASVAEMGSWIAGVRLSDNSTRWVWRGKCIQPRC